MANKLGLQKKLYRKKIWYASHYQSLMIDEYGAFSGMTVGRGKWKYKSAQCHLSTTYPTEPELGLKPGCCGGKPVTNHFCYGILHVLLCVTKLLFYALVPHSYATFSVHPVNFTTV
jgi:hypothetical protein